MMPSGISILFVCTGNTCRSPMAEAICKRRLADLVGCEPAELPGLGYEIHSAGVAAGAGDEASPPAVEVVRELGADLSGHQSKPVDPDLLATATHVIAMTRTHAMALAMQFPGIGPMPKLLCGNDGDLLDPIGGDLDVYRDCAELIRMHLDRILSELRSNETKGADGA